MTYQLWSVFITRNLFADVVLLYHLITDTMDYTVLQEAITLLEDWAIINHLNFNVSKCKYGIISRRNSRNFPAKLVVSARRPSAKS